MGLARELSEGPRRRRHRGAGRFQLSDDYVRLRALTKIVEARPAGEDLDAIAAQMRPLIEAVGARPARMRFEEGAIFNAACSAYRYVTGERIGPETGTV